MTTYRRSELYEQAWSEPLRVIAQRYGVSDVALGKICRRLCVPLPGRGHWTRVQLGQSVSRPPLPSLPADLSDTVTVERRQHRDAVPDPSVPRVVVCH